MKNITPFLKWVGGKRQLMPQLNKTIEKFNKVKKFHEPFVGGGALFIDRLANGKSVSSINDLNFELVNAYKVVRDSPDDLIVQLIKLEKNHTRFQYYDIRKMDRDGRLEEQSDIFKAARMIYLNKTGYNGIYRVNRKGQFNVPIGSIWEKRIFDLDNLLELSKAFNKSNLRIFNESYEYIKEVAKKGDLVYFDPPYDSFEEGNNFVGYQKEGFSRHDQRKLKETCDWLISRGVGVIISNHNTKFILELYGDKKYYFQEIVEVSRSINSNGEKRKKKPIEVIIYGGINE